MDKFRASLREQYFQVLTNSNIKTKQDLYSAVVSILLDTIDLRAVGLYIYNQNKRHFHIEALTGRHANTLLQQSVDINIDYYTESFMENMNNIIEEEELFHNLNVNYTIVPIKTKQGLSGFIAFVFDDHMPTRTLEWNAVIKEETEKLFSLVLEQITIERKKEKNKYLFQYTSKLFTIKNKSDIFREIITSIKEIYPSYSYYLLLSQDYDADETLPIKSLEYGDAETVRASTEAFISGEIQMEDRVKEQCTHIFAPLIGNQGVYGVLEIISPSSMEYSNDEIDFIEQFVNISGKAIENVSLYQESKRLVYDLTLINDTSHQLNSSLKINEIIHLVRRKIKETCEPKEIGFIYLPEDKGLEINILSGSTLLFETKIGVELAEQLVSTILNKGESIFSGEFHCKQTKDKYKSIMAIPMSHADSINGVVIILEEQSYAFSLNSFKLIQSLIRHSTLAMLNTILKEKLEKAVETDYLTDLYSRNYLDEQIRKHMKHGEMGTLILLDIDNFKLVNDTYGHYIGDEVIKQVASIITTHIDEVDIGARWGGEELAVYLPDTGLEDGVQLAGVIRKQVANFTDPSVTVSAGVSTWKNTNPDNAKDFFIRADRALYDAKGFGKNCVFKIEYGEGSKLQV